MYHPQETYEFLSLIDDERSFKIFTCNLGTKTSVIYDVIHLIYLSCSPRM